MTKPLTPQVIETLTAGYVVGNLDPTESDIFEQLLAETPALVTEVNRLQTTLDQVVYSLNSVEPPPHLHATILAAVTVAVQRPRLKTSRFSWPVVITSIAALLILFLGVDNYQMRQELSISQDIHNLLQQSKTQLFSLKAVNVINTAAGSFIVNLEQRQGILVVQNLVAPPTGKVYRLWAIADGEKIPCGTLTISPQGKVNNKFWMPADFYDTDISGLVVTIESSETGRYPTGEIVMQSNLSSKI
jgi:anti-sigma-K factor RskA